MDSSASLERQAGRWYRRTVWYLGRFGLDLGFGRADRPPLWLKDNPFLTRAVRQSARGPALFVQSTLLLLALVAVVYLAFSLDRSSSRSFAFTAHIIFRMTVRELMVAMTVTVHWMLILFLWISQLSRVAQDQRRRHWLAVMSTVPAHRTELVLAEAMASSGRRLLVHCTAIPLYALLWQLAGLEWSTLICLFGLFVVADFVILPVPPPPAANRRKSFLGMTQTRVKQTVADQIPYAFLMFFVITVLVSELPGLGHSPWALDFLRPLHIRPPFEMIQCVLVFPYFTASTVTQSIEFLRGSVWPWLYVFPICLALRVASAFEVGAKMSTLEGGEEEDGGGGKRARLAAAACVYVILFVTLAYAWRACILSGDAAFLTGPSSTVLGNRHTVGWSVTGLLVMFAIAAAAIALVRVLAVRTHTRSGSPRRGLGMARRYVAVTMRAVAPVLAVYVIACCCGWCNPFPREAMSTLGRLVLTLASTVIFGAGVRRVLTGVLLKLSVATQKHPRIGPAQVASGVAASIGALFLPVPFASTVAACLPYYAWLNVLPVHGVVVQACRALAMSNGVSMSTPPSQTVCLLLPALTGIVFWMLAPSRGVQPAPTPIRRTVVRRRRHVSTPSFLAARIDNPVFLRDFMRSLPRLPVHPLVALVGVLFVTGVFTWYDVKIAGGGFYAAVGVPQATIDDAVGLWALTAMAPLMMLGFIMFASAGYWAGERILVEESEQGSLGALLISPMKDRQIVVARMVGRFLGAAVGPVLLVLVTLALMVVALRNPANASIGPVWLTVEALSLAVFLWGIGGGVSISTAVMRLRWLRGGSLIAAFSGPALVMWLTWYELPSLADQPSDALLVALIAIGIVAATVACGIGMLFAYDQFRRLRRGDIVYGDQPGG